MDLFGLVLFLLLLLVVKIHEWLAWGILRRYEKGEISDDIYY